MARFPTNDMMDLIGPAPRFDLAESLGPELHLRDVLEGEDIALGYGSAAGDPHLRATIASRHGVDPDDVVVTAGGMHALFLLAFTLCGPGDEAIITAPIFPLARTALEAVSARINTVKLDFDRRYQPDPVAVQAALSARTKLVSVASPQNPSGVAIPRETLGEILAAMQEVCPNAFLLVDESYREAVYGPNPVAQSAIALDKRIVSVASLSKCHGAPGLRIGWGITRDKTLREQLVVAKFSTVLCCSAVDEALALQVLRQDPTSRRKHFAAGLARVEAWVRQNARHVDWVRPDAGAICCIRLKPAAFDDANIARFYSQLEGRGIRVANGAWFGDDARVFRLGFGLLPLQDLEAALTRVSDILRTEFKP